MFFGEQSLRFRCCNDLSYREQPSAMQRRLPISFRQFFRPGCSPAVAVSIDNFVSEDNVANAALRVQRSSETGRDDELRAVGHDAELWLVEKPFQCAFRASCADACLHDQDGQPRRSAESRPARSSWRSLCRREFTAKCLRLAAQGEDNAGIGEANVYH